LDVDTGACEAPLCPAASRETVSAVDRTVRLPKEAAGVEAARLKTVYDVLDPSLSPSWHMISFAQGHVENATIQPLVYCFLATTWE
jgi:hypothetical protein